MALEQDLDPCQNPGDVQPATITGGLESGTGAACAAAVYPCILHPASSHRFFLNRLSTFWKLHGRKGGSINV